MTQDPERSRSRAGPGPCGRAASMTPGGRSGGRHGATLSARSRAAASTGCIIAAATSERRRHRRLPMSLRHHEIAEADHRILDPFTDEKLRLLGEVCAGGPGHPRARSRLRQGRDAVPLGRMVRATGVGVDLSPVFLEAARGAGRGARRRGPRHLRAGRRRRRTSRGAGAFDVAVVPRRDLDRRTARRGRSSCSGPRSGPAG